MKKIRNAAAWILLFAGCATVPAAASTDPQVIPQNAEPMPWKEGMKVHELLYLDTLEALRLARARQQAAQRMAGGGVVSQALPADLPQLVAIYGVGARLFAEVMVQGQAMVFAKGLPDPLGAGSKPFAYRLEGITSRCIRLSGEADKHTLCLPQNGQARP